MKKIIFRMLIVVLMSVAIGSVYNSSLDEPLPIFKKYDSGFIEKLTKRNRIKMDNGPLKYINASALYKLLLDNQITILDARQPLEYEMGHIPGAINLPISDFEVEYHKLSGFLEKNQTLVTYCSEITCSDSELLAQQLNELGFLDVFVYKGGYKEWQTDGFPVEKNAENPGKNE